MAITIPETMLFRTPKLTQEHLNVIVEIDKTRQALAYSLLQQPKRWTGILARTMFARTIQQSNTIEGYHVTEDDAIAAVVEEEPIGEKDAAWLAVCGYRDALSYILQLAPDPFYKHNEGTIKSLHYMMLKQEVSKNPGRWRHGAIHVRNVPSGDIVYEGPDVELVPRLMSELINSLNAPDGSPVMVRAAMAHLNLVMIHPFSDGNGRMARALQTFVLAREGIMDPRFSSIEEYLGHHVQDYYSVLAEVGQGKWHPENDATPWIRFCLVAHYRQAANLQRRIKQTEALWNLLENEVNRRHLHERCIFALMDAAVGRKVRNGTYRALAEVSEQVASRDLHDLVEVGLLVAQGERRGRFYTASKWLRDQCMSVRLKKIEADPFVLFAEPQAQQEQFRFAAQGAE